MTQPAPLQPESDLLPPEPAGALSVPPPVPQKKPGLLRRLFTSRKKQQAVAIQNGYLEMVDLIRAIRSHLDRQENVQTSLLTMLEKVPAVMDRQQEVMTIFKQQLENGMENNRRLTDSMGNLNNTLASMDESQRASSRTVTDLIHRSRESEQLLREVMRRAERRMTILLVVFFLLVLGLGLYFVRWQPRAGRTAAKAAVTAPAVAEKAATPAAKAAKPAVADEPAIAAKPVSVKEPAKPEPAQEPAPAPETKKKSRSKTKNEPKPEAVAEPVLGKPDLTLDQLRPDIEAALAPAPVAPEPNAALP